MRLNLYKQQPLQYRRMRHDVTELGPATAGGLLSSLEAATINVEQSVNNCPWEYGSCHYMKSTCISNAPIMPMCLSAPLVALHYSSLYLKAARFLCSTIQQHKTYVSCLLRSLSQFLSGKIFTVCCSGKSYYIV